MGAVGLGEGWEEGSRRVKGEGEGGGRVGEREGLFWQKGWGEAGKWGAPVLLFTLHYSAQNRTMSDAATRRGTRQKKPSRHYWYDKAEFGSQPGAKNCEQKERVNSAQEVNQLAKLLAQFMHSTNGRYRDLIDAQTTDPKPLLPDQSKEADSHGTDGNRRNDVRSTRDNSNDPRNNRQPGINDQGNGEPKVSNKEAKSRAGRSPKSHQQLAASLETDLSYHNALNEHVKNAYPNINALSPDMLRDLSIPIEIIGKKDGARSKAEDKKKQPASKPAKEQKKPFKRQSYHVAIAYHIHRKQVKNTKSVEYVDPTFPARKLREQSQPQSKKA